MNRYVLACGFMIILVSILPSSAFGGSGIPEWIKTTIQWLNMGIISDTEFKSAMEYLISYDIISTDDLFAMGIDMNSDNVKQLESNVQPTIDKSSFKMAPELFGITGYINTSPEELEQAMKDKVVMYDIWTYSCINCIRTLPYVTSWDEKYSEQGLLIIGVHSPEFSFEKDINNVERAVDKHGIEYPVVLDNEMEIWRAFENRYWPRAYIADHEGYIRYDHIGEGGYDETEKMIQSLLDERKMALGI